MLSLSSRPFIFANLFPGPFLLSRPSTESENPPPNSLTTTGQLTPQHQRSPRWLHLLIIATLLLVSLVPRLVLALQLDLVTDEAIYIRGGKTYLPLLTTFNIGAHGWAYNYEHPPLVKLLIGLFLSFNDILGHPLGELLASRLTSICAGVLLVLLLYLLGRAPFGNVVALAAALSLALSPWLSYFSALAYLDMTMTAFITIAYLLLWHAIRRPWLYLLVALLVGCGAASKYTAVLSVPAMVLFTAYYFFLLRPRLPAEQRPPVPWRWWLAAIVLAPLAFLAVDPAIWPDPYNLLLHSFDFEWNHSLNGHLTFLAGQYGTHVQHWAIVYILGAKISAFVTIPATLFALFALVQIVRFHLRASRTQPAEIASMAFAASWLLATLGLFSLLNIVVGTHYYLPLAAPVALCGACGLATLLRYRRGDLFRQVTREPQANEEPAPPPARSPARPTPRAALLCAVLLLAMTGSHLIGLLTVPAAEGYTSELFQGENDALQVAYPGYREALQWLSAHDSAHASVGLAAIGGTLNIGKMNSTWYAYNVAFTRQFRLSEVAINPESQAIPDLSAYDYLIWPMHLIQRGYPLPDGWNQHVIQTISGGVTTYCFILARPSFAKGTS